MSAPVYRGTRGERGLARVLTSGQVSFVDDGHSDRCEVIAHCGSNLHFPSYVCGPPACSLRRNACSAVLQCLFLSVLSRVSSSRVRDLDPSSDVPVANGFSHAVRCPLVLLMVSFTVRKLFSLISFHLFTFPFVFLAQGDLSKEILPRVMSEGLLPMFSPRSSIVSGPTSKSPVHFRFIFVCSVMYLSSFPNTVHPCFPLCPIDASAPTPAPRCLDHHSPVVHTAWNRVA